MEDERRSLKSPQYLPMAPVASIESDYVPMRHEPIYNEPHHQNHDMLYGSKPPSKVPTASSIPDLLHHREKRCGSENDLLGSKSAMNVAESNLPHSPIYNSSTSKLH